MKDYPCKELIDIVGDPLVAEQFLKVLVSLLRSQIHIYEHLSYADAPDFLSYLASQIHTQGLHDGCK
jgi:hypothetical protein